MIFVECVPLSNEHCLQTWHVLGLLGSDPTSDWRRVYAEGMWMKMYHHFFTPTPPLVALPLQVCEVLEHFIVGHLVCPLLSQMPCIETYFFIAVGT